MADYLSFQSNSKLIGDKSPFNTVLTGVYLYSFGRLITIDSRLTLFK
jgi:hypothetical protein